jgi:predicted phosphoadenosine phosphosulfate sulfurtransferase
VADTRRARAQFLARRALTDDVWTLAVGRAAATLARFDHAAVMFSGGKDSTATLHAVLEAAHTTPGLSRHLPMRVIFFDEEAIPVETADYVRRTFARDDVAGEWYCLPIKHRNACSRRSPWWWPWAPEAEHLWCRPLPPEAITRLDGFPIWPAEARLTNPDMNGLQFPPALGNCVMFMGIRAQESLTRSRSVTRVSRTGGENYVIKFDQGTSRGNLWKCYPVYDWTHADVWTAPALMDWDYNKAYDRLEMAGVPIGLQRCSPAFGEEPLQKLHTYASCFPEVWAKMVDRVPGVGAAARYALTELYAYRDRPGKPAGMPWPEFIVHYVTQFGQADVARIAARLRSEIRVHYQVTAHPISETAPHPHTGVSWDFLLMVAMRGDFKGRKQAGARVHTDDQGRPEPKFWHRYARELATVIAEGRFADLAHPGPAPSDPFALVPEYAQAAGLTGVPA